MKYFVRFFNRTSSVNDMNVKKMNFKKGFNASWGLELRHSRGVATCKQIRNCVPENNNKKNN